MAEKLGGVCAVSAAIVLRLRHFQSFAMLTVKLIPTKANAGLSFHIKESGIPNKTVHAKLCGIKVTRDRWRRINLIGYLRRVAMFNGRVAIDSSLKNGE